MATILLSAAGAAIGGSVGGTFAGLSSVAIGRAVGATVGRVVDQRLLGQGGQAVETGKVDRFRLTGSGEGNPVSQIYGRMRVGGQIIWASDFEEAVSVSGGGKGARPTPKTTEYSYTVSIAVALCEGVITRVGRIWADGEEIAPDDLNMRIYCGDRDQLPDPVMEAIEGTGKVPAYRGTAYVVFEHLDLGCFGNRVPQFSFEVVRPEQQGTPEADYGLSYGIQGVALIPGTGEYALATTPVHYVEGQGESWSANINTPAGKTDFDVALDNLVHELPNLKAASLVVSWFGDDLRCGHCTIRPKVEDAVIDGENMPWTVSGLQRHSAQVIAQADGRPIYGGTPTDQSVIEAIRAMNANGKEVLFYPFILMDQTAENTLPDPYSDAESQPNLPWRGRITLSKAPHVSGSPDGTATANAEVDAFFGLAVAADFTVNNDEVFYTGPDEWSFSRFILHNAALCLAAGGVDAFCIGSEMRGLTQIRGAGGIFVAVERLRSLAAEVRAILGPDVKLSYAADWSEYFGYQPKLQPADRYFHLDPLWADENIDFVGIDNYMPLSDWREDDAHLDGQAWDSIYNLDYLKSNIEGGEGYDWFYHSAEARAAQIRTEITDGAHDEPWVYRYKDIRNWWSQAHHERIGGIRQSAPTDWIAMSKPIWFTEYGCAAIDKGTNQPNKFLDLKSSESSLPRHSSGARDDFIQMQYLRAMNAYWSDPVHNPVSPEYGEPMLDMRRAFVWAWDMRPYPQFPNNSNLWSDGTNYARGHWINGRTSSQPLATVVDEICRISGLTEIDTSRLYGSVRGYAVDQVTEARASLQSLMIRYGFDALERGGVLQFRLRKGAKPTVLQPDSFAVSGELDGVLEQVREPEAEMSGRVRLRFVQADGDFDAVAEEAVLATDATHAVAATEVNMTLTRSEARQIVERWLTESRVARERVRFALPRSKIALGVGDVVELPADGNEGPARYRIDRSDQADVQLIEAVRIEPEVYDPPEVDDELVSLRSFVAPVPVVPFFLDLPLLRGDEVPHAPHVCATARPWPGSVALYQSSTDSNFQLNTILPKGATIGETKAPLFAARPGLIDRGGVLEVKLTAGALESVDMSALLAGANLAAIGDGSSDNWEVFQFGQAELVAPRTYWLDRRLRGQAGSDALIPEVWPAGSVFVLLDGTPKQMALSPNLRRIVQYYRIGPAQRGYDDPSYREMSLAFDGNGLRPYRPCHLCCSKQSEGGRRFSWVRRTRINGDNWENPEVPLGEESEQYLVRVVQDGNIIRETITDQTAWHYTSEAQAGDGVSESFEIRVSQISALYGQGPSANLRVSG